MTLLTLFRTQESDSDVEAILEGGRQADAGLTYTALPSLIENYWPFQCDQCKQVADIMTRPFPHLPGCAMLKAKEYYTTAHGVTRCSDCGRTTSSMSSASFPHDEGCSVLTLIRKNLRK